MKEDLDNEPDYLVSPLLASTEVISAQASYSLTRHSREVVLNMVERSECISLCESDQVCAKRMVCFTYRKKRVVSVYHTLISVADQNTRICSINKSCYKL